MAEKWIQEAIKSGLVQRARLAETLKNLKK